jgi:hypothetical protein
MSFAKDESNISTSEVAQNKGRLTTDAIAGAGKNETTPTVEESERPLVGKERHDGHGERLEPLFDERVDHDFRDRWREIQTGFVDEPRRTVEQADELVAELMQRLAQSFSEQRSNLEHQWDASDQVSTEDLRVALTRYRSFFERLLSI